MIRVLFALGSLGGGGAERQTLNWIRHLPRDRFAPSLFLLTRRGELGSLLPDDVPVVAYEDRHAPPSIYFPGHIARMQARELETVATERKIDVLVTVTLHMTLLGWGMTRRPAGWLAVEMADPRRDFDDQITRFRSIKRRRLAAAYRVATPVAVSEGVRQGLASFYGVPDGRAAVLPNFIDLGDLDRRVLEPVPPLACDRFHVVTVGRLEPQKGQRHLLEAFASLVNDHGLRRLHLHLLGEGFLRAELEAFVRDAGLREHVSFEGFVSNPVAYVRRCDLFCLPSLYEGLPLALLEAMACGVPTIATNCESGPGEVLAGGRFGTLVPTGDSVALAQAIHATYVDPATAQKTARAARGHVERHYAATVVMRELEQLLADAAGRPPNGSA